ncbi:sulfate transport system ATP-binding protein [Solimonas aquatica]|uniref:Sulfate transport system ATP-binding protein n=1 Tax=Solimonas aquatica TaxID=489703 RepID=A0A1H9LKZ6_9GAMM|nr:sulfate/molybdate ABC transporter ATP-binding protein [Solimonas aquatica]SER12038.1 sulfate transport system ATP-binding protein [Solimonas aquatica]
MDIHVRGIHKSFGGFKALSGVDLDIASGELIALLGPSGSGKTTLLRVIAGLEFPEQGQILFGDEDMAARPIRERRVGFVFQHYALFKHMTVLDNIAFGLRVRERGERPPEATIRARARELLDLVQLSGLEKRYPAQLSGGQRQRVALARALAIDPRLLLLDEPFGALDAKVRKDLRRWLRSLHEQTGYTTIFVTHDQEEALELADRVVIMNRGQIEQVGSTDEVYEKPASPFVFDFLGNTNVLPGEARGREVFIDGHDTPIVTDTIHPNGAVDIYVRPGDLRLADGGIPGFYADVRSTQRTGPIVRCEAQAVHSGQLIELEFPHLHHDAPRLQPGQRVYLRLNNFSIFPRGQGKPGAKPSDPTVLIGSERERGRLG